MENISPCAYGLCANKKERKINERDFFCLIISADRKTFTLKRKRGKMKTS
jgi:hypothetical protein